MIYLLDTNVVSELRRAGEGRADPNVTAWAGGLTAQSFYLSAICVMELEIGIQRHERKDAAQGAMLRKWLEGHVLPFFADRIVPVDEHVAIRCAGLHVPDKKSERDSLIAATALVHDMTVATRNVKDFKSTGAKLLNPWEPMEGSQDA